MGSQSTLRMPTHVGNQKEPTLTHTQRAVHSRGAEDGRPETTTILSTAAVAETLGVPEGTLRYWRYMDEGPKSFRLGRHVKYRLTDVEAWINQQAEATGRGG